MSAEIDQDASNNPYALAIGTKFWMLETEAWSPSSRSYIRKKSITLNESQLNGVNNTAVNDSMKVTTPQEVSNVDVAPPATHTLPSERTQNTPSNLTRSLAAAPKEPSVNLSAEDKSDVHEVVKPSTTAQEDSTTTSQATPTLSSSPAFLPANPALMASARSTSPAQTRHPKPVAYKPKSSTAGTTSAYHSVSPTTSAGFTYVSVPEGRNIDDLKRDRRKSQASSMGDSAPREFGRSTLASSFVSSMAASRSNEGQQAQSSGNLAASEMLKRFQQAVKSTTAAETTSSVRS